MFRFILLNLVNPVYFCQNKGIWDLVCLVITVFVLGFRVIVFFIAY